MLEFISVSKRETEKYSKLLHGDKNYFFNSIFYSLLFSLINFSILVLNNEILFPKIEKKSMSAFSTLVSAYCRTFLPFGVKITTFALVSDECSWRFMKFLPSNVRKTLEIIIRSALIGYLNLCYCIAFL